MSILEDFDALMIHLNSKEDDLAIDFREQLKETEDNLLWLTAIESAGVDNWEGCDFARELYNEWVGEDEEED